MRNLFPRIATCNACSPEMSSGLKLLNSYYKLGFSLKDFLSRVCDVAVVLENEDDPECYLWLMRSSFVGLDTLDAFSRHKFKPSEIIPEAIEVRCGTNYQRITLTQTNLGD